MKNHADIETIDKVRHATLRVKPDSVFAHSKGYNVVAISLAELSACTSNFPSVFIRNQDDTGFRLVSLLGLRPGENLYFGEERWDASYIPRIIHTHPFVVAFDDRKEEPVLTACINKTSAHLSETDGIALFTPEGVETDFLNTMSGALRETFEAEKLTSEFTYKLDSLGLLVPIEILVQPENGEPRRITGMWGLSESKLRALTSEQVLELHKLDFLAGCYIIMGSLFQLHRLIQLRNQKSDEKLLNYRIEMEPQLAAQPAAQ